MDTGGATWALRRRSSKDRRAHKTEKACAQGCVTARGTGQLKVRSGVFEYSTDEVGT